MSESRSYAIHYVISEATLWIGNQLHFIADLNPRAKHSNSVDQQKAVGLPADSSTKLNADGLDFFFSIFSLSPTSRGLLSKVPPAIGPWTLQKRRLQGALTTERRTPKNFGSSPASV